MSGQLLGNGRVEKVSFKSDSMSTILKIKLPPENPCNMIPLSGDIRSFCMGVGCIYGFKVHIYHVLKANLLGFPGN